MSIPHILTNNCIHLAGGRPMLPPAHCCHGGSTTINIFSGGPGFGAPMPIGFGFGRSPFWGGFQNGLFAGLSTMFMGRMFNNFMGGFMGFGGGIQLPMFNVDSFIGYNPTLSSGYQLLNPFNNIPTYNSNIINNGQKNQDSPILDKCEDDLKTVLAYKDKKNLSDAEKAKIEDLYKTLTQYKDTPKDTIDGTTDKNHYTRIYNDLTDAYKFDNDGKVTGPAEKKGNADAQYIQDKLDDFSNVLAYKTPEVVAAHADEIKALYKDLSDKAKTPLDPENEDQDKRNYETLLKILKTKYNFDNEGNPTLKKQTGNSNSPDIPDLSSLSDEDLIKLASVIGNKLNFIRANIDKNRLKDSPDLQKLFYLPEYTNVEDSDLSNISSIRVVRAHDMKITDDATATEPVDIVEKTKECNISADKKTIKLHYGNNKTRTYTLIENSNPKIYKSENVNEKQHYILQKDPNGNFVLVQYFWMDGYKKADVKSA